MCVCVCVCVCMCMCVCVCMCVYVCVCVCVYDRRCCLQRLSPSAMFVSLHARLFLLHECLRDGKHMESCALTQAQSEQSYQALLAMRETRKKALTRWLPEETCDELQSSFALYTLVATAAVVEGDLGRQEEEAIGTRTLDAAAVEAVEVAEAVYGCRAARGILLEGSPSALRRELECVCEKIPRGEALSALVWKALGEVAAARWGEEATGIAQGQEQVVSPLRSSSLPK